MEGYKDNTYTITEPLQKGLEPFVHGLRNVPLLIESIGAVPYQQMLISVQQFARITGLPTCNFPYPQLFVLSNVILICTSNAIYEFNGASLALKITGLPVGSLWECADYKTYLYLTNGQVVVTRDPESTLYAIDTSLPFATAICDFNSQLFVGSLNTGYIEPVGEDSYLLDEDGNYILDELGNRIRL